MNFPKQLVYRIHAVRRMFERQISEDQVQAVLDNGQIIREYLDDKPYPSFLILGWIKKRPLHIVVAKNEENDQTIIITVYEPGIEEWIPGFQERRDL